MALKGQLLEQILLGAGVPHPPEVMTSVSVTLDTSQTSVRWNSSQLTVTEANTANKKDFNARIINAKPAGFLQDRNVFNSTVQHATFNQKPTSVWAQF